MFEGIRAGRAAKRARQQYELVRIEVLIAENDARLAELERRRSEPCPMCVQAENARRIHHCGDDFPCPAVPL